MDRNSKSNGGQAMPILRYPEKRSFMEWGRIHGETYRESIHRLVEIRRELMRERNPAMVDSKIRELAQEQWMATEKWAPEIAQELQGICEGSGLPVEDIVVLNNYTDFRDIHLPEEGCTTVAVHTENNRLAGQTWDMHSSARDHVIFLKVPSISGKTGEGVSAWVFTLTGCVGMAGFNSLGRVVGVNNINTREALPAVVWPAIVRRMLMAGGENGQMTALMKEAAPCSGHNYMLVGGVDSAMWEVTPREAERVDVLPVEQRGYMLHTNHCLGPRTKELELKGALASTTHDRYRLAQKKLGAVLNLEGMVNLLRDHEEYPRSICSHFESGSQDPSMTCGGMAFDVGEGRGILWRGCPKYGDFAEHKVDLYD